MKSKDVKKLKKYITMLHAVIQELPGSIYWKNTKGTYLGCNTYGTIKFRNQTLNQNPVVGKTDYELFSKEVAEQYFQHDSEVMKTGKEICVEETIKTHRGEIITQLSYKKPLRDPEGNILGVMGNTIDVTYLKKIEAELREAKDRAEVANQAKTEFLKNMRHDIRTPLHGIVGLTAMLYSEKDTDKIRLWTAQLSKSSKELFLFLNEVLESINVVSGKIPLRQNKFDLRVTLNRLIDLHRAKAVEKGLRLEVHVNRDIPKYLIGDQVRIYRVVLELLSNALKFTQEGHVTVSADLAKRNNHELVVKVMVQDTGIGIAEDKQRELFAAFKRLTPACEYVYEGVGLGLFIVKQFLEDLKGEVYINSHPGQGSQFVCLFPLKESLLRSSFGKENFSERDIRSVFSSLGALSNANSIKEENPYGISL